MANGLHFPCTEAHGFVLAFAEDEQMPTVELENRILMYSSVFVSSVLANAYGGNFCSFIVRLKSGERPAFEVVLC